MNGQPLKLTHRPSFLSITIGLVAIACLNLTSEASEIVERSRSASRDSAQQTPRSGRGQTQPGTQVRWIHFPAQKHTSNADWGPFLTDIENHLPDEYGDKYRHDDQITHAHETTHGINGHISNRLNHTGQRAYGFYVGGDRAIMLVEPRVKLSDVAAVIPQSVRGSRYRLYLHDQQKYFEDEPLYVFDEWTAYVNGAQAGIEQVCRSPASDTRCDAVVGALELGIYSLGLAVAVRKHDPEYLVRHPEFLEFLAHELRRSSTIYRRGIVLPRFRWDRSLETNLLNRDDALELRAALREFYGNRLSLEDLLPRSWGPERAWDLSIAGADGATDKVVGATIEGTVRDLAERRQADVEVRLEDVNGKALARTTTDKKGRFAFRGLAPGKYTLSLEKDPGAGGMKTIEVSAGTTVRDDLHVPRWSR